MKRVVAASWLVLLLFGGAGCDRIWPRPECMACRRPLQSRALYRLTFENGEHQDFCCPRCGLHFRGGPGPATQMHVADYLSGELIAAEEAYWVENSELMLCCSEDGVRRDQSGGLFERSWDRCMPSLVGFKQLEEAQSFRDLKGGTIKTYDQLLSE